MLIKHKKGQTSFEFLVLLGFMLIVFGTFFLLMQQFISSGHENQVRDALITIANGVRDEILIANQVHRGYEREFTIPRDVLGQSYRIEIEGDELIAITENPIYFEYLIFLPIIVELDYIPNLNSSFNPRYIISNPFEGNITIREAATQ